VRHDLSVDQLPGHLLTGPRAPGPDVRHDERLSDVTPVVRLLLVEDDDGDALLVTDLLRAGQLDLDVTRVTDLTQALRRLAVPPGPDVVVLDLGLPDAEGVEIVGRIVAADPNAAVVVLTGLADEGSGAAAVSSGAQDYLVKGQVDEWSLARSIRYAVGRKRVQESTRQLVEMNLQKRQNARLERGLLPRPWIQTGDWLVRTGYRPGQNRSLLGGDFFDVVERPDGRLHVVIGDVAGHGPDEAALGVLLRAAWRALVLAGTPAPRVLPLLALQLGSERPSEEVFATALYLVLDPDADWFEVFNAGHPTPASVPAAPAPAWVVAAGPPLGVVDDWSWPAQRLAATGRFPLLLYTDGLIEGRSGDERLGEPGLLTIVSAERGAVRPTELIDRLILRAEQAHGQALPDDVAVLLIDRLTEQGPG
jgi:serine phosphatase RsbU (regulator of sigma subunit)